MSDPDPAAGARPDVGAQRREHGDRAGFLGRIRSRQGLPPTTGPHPPPAPPDVVPIMGYRSLDGIDPGDADGLLGVFVDAVRAAEATVSVVDLAAGQIPGDAIWEILATHEIRTAICSTEPIVELARDAVRSAGVEITPYDRVTAERADLAITSATHTIAATGSVVVDSASAGSRAVSLLPRVHLCIVPAEVIVPTTAEVLRGSPWPMPSCRVLVTGPSRTGDIEQLLTLGAHGPTALHVLVVR